MKSNFISPFTNSLSYPEVLLQIINKLSYPAIIFIVFLAVADEDVILVVLYYACHRVNIISSGLYIIST